jgi:hypothetical protein
MAMRFESPSANANMPTPNKIPANMSPPHTIETRLSPLAMGPVKEDLERSREQPGRGFYPLKVIADVLDEFGGENCGGLS